MLQGSHVQDARLRTRPEVLLLQGVHSTLSTRGQSAAEAHLAVRAAGERRQLLGSQLGRREAAQQRRRARGQLAQQRPRP